MALMIIWRGKVGKLVEFLHENGFFLTLRFVVEHLHTKIFNYFLTKKLSVKHRLYIHPSACIRGLKHMDLGINFHSGKHLWLEAVPNPEETEGTPKIQIGHHVSVNENVHIASISLVKIGDNVLMASRIFISDHNHGIYSGEHGSSPDTPPNDRIIAPGLPVIIEDNVWIGEMVSILPGVTIGKGSVIGSNSVVTRSIPPYSIAVGAPAQPIKRYDFLIDRWVKIGESR